MIPRIREVHIRNYKSIAEAVVPLSDLTVLVGANGSGKTNFVDALAFVQECLAESVQRAFLTRNMVRHRAAGAQEPIGIRIIVDLDHATAADYSFEVASEAGHGFRVRQERCVITHQGGMTYRFRVQDGALVEEIPGLRPRVEPDRLVLYAASATAEFRGIYDFLVGMRLYRIDPEAVRMLDEPASDFDLLPHGSNAASILRQLQKHDRNRFERVNHLLSRVVPGLQRVEPVSFGPFNTLEFVEHGMKLRASSMSEGTLRLFGMLLAIYQLAPHSVLMFEEPETAIHPGAAEVVMSVLMDAATRSQVIVTTHSPDILEHKSLADDAIRVVTKEEGRTLVAPVSAASRQSIRERLYSAGELLRIDELNPDLGAAADLSRGTSLFGEPARVRGEAA